MNLFEFQSYRSVLAEKIKENESIYGYQTLLAKEARCHRSYLSQVLSGKSHFTGDQLHALGRHWVMSGEEIVYLLDLLNLEKAATLELQRFYREKLSIQRKKMTSISSRIKKKSASENQLYLFHSSWIHLAVYTLMFIPRYQTREAVAEYFETSLRRIQPVLDRLLKEGLLKKNRQNYVPVSLDIHLAKNSPFLPSYLRSWRDRAVESARSNHDTDTHYTALYTMSKKDSDQFLERCLQLIEESRKTAIQSQDESELVCLNLDWFRVQTG